MQEIEAKFKIVNMNELKEKLISLGCELSSPLNQKDTVFLPDINDTSSEEGKIFIRIRNVNGLSEITLKKRSKVLMQSKEIEFSVSDFESAYDFLDTLGLKEWVTVEKQRITTSYQGFNICLNEVKRLGSFLEIEVLTNEENKTDYYEKQILDLCRKLNIDTSNRINSFYDVMISELNETEKC